MEPFKYEPLQLEEPCFRLVRLIGGNDQTIRCDLFHASNYDAEDAIEYEALSYTWGDTKRSNLMEINSKRFYVTDNLLEALQHLRYEAEDRILWIDAICINQSNPSERGHQVQQMPAIYENASQVIFWLGTATPDTDLVFTRMQQFERQTLNYPCGQWAPKDDRWHFIWSSIELLEQERKDSDIRARHYSAFAHLLSQPWFRRVWIVQEVAKARRAKVMCGTKTCSARIFTVVPNVIKATVDPHQQAILDIMPGPSRKHSWWVDKRDLYTLLGKFRESQATDPRDLIYALLGISSDAHSTEYLVPDYKKSLEEVVRTTIAFLLELETLGICSDCLPSSLLADFMSKTFDLNRRELLEDIIFRAIGEQSNGKLQIVSALGIQGIKYLSTSKGTIFTPQENTVDISPKDNGWKVVVGPCGMNIEYLDHLSREGQISTPLSWAARQGCAEMVDMLLRSGTVDVNFCELTTGETPLFKAIRKGHDSIVGMFLESEEVDRNLRNFDGQTPLQVAESEHLNSMAWRLRRPVQINTQVDSEQAISRPITSGTNSTAIHTIPESPQAIPTRSAPQAFQKGNHFDINRLDKLPFVHLSDLGHGHSGMVAKVRDEITGAVFARKRLQIPAAIKRVRTKLLHSFHNETSTILKLRPHHHVIDLFATYATDDHYGLLLQPVADGGDLSDFLGRFWTFLEGTQFGTQERLLKHMSCIAKQALGCLASGLVFMHKAGIRHGDIQPSNILVHKGSVLYIDFEFSTDAAFLDAFDTRGNFTKMYAAPEALHLEGTDEYSDVFSLGCVFIELLAALLGRADLRPERSALSSNQNRPFAESMGQIQLSLLQLRPSEDKYFLPTIIASMTEIDRMGRPTAESVWQRLLDRPGYFCAQCCTIPDGSPQDLTQWQWSEEYEDYYIRSRNEIGNAQSSPEKRRD